MRTKLKIVLDTNVFLVSLAEHYKYHWIFQSILADQFELCLSTEILLEYQEIIEQRYGIKKTEDILGIMK